MSALAFAVVLIVQGLVVPGQNGVVTGQVRTREGAPAAGVRVVAQAAESGGPSTDGAAFASLAETDAQGRYRLEGVPPGRYYIAAGLVSALSYYPGVAAITEATTVMVASGSAPSGIDFALVRSVGVRVSGTVRGIPDNVPSNVRRVALSPINAPGTRLTDVALQPGGKFEFSRVFPGSYNVLTSATPTATIRIEVGDRDIADIEVKLPPVLSGRVVVEGGEKLPIQAAAVAAGVTDPPAPIRLQARRASVNAATATPTVGGVFILVLPPGEYQIVFPLLPLGYHVKSFTHGSVNLLEAPLVVTENTKEEIQLLLTKTPPPGVQPGVTVSGRVNDIPADGVPNPPWVTIQSATNVAGVTQQRMSEVLVQADGTFALQDVPPGNYTIRPSSGPAQSISVTTTGLTGVELQYTASRNVVSGPILAAPLPLRAAPTPIQISGKVVIVPGTAMPKAIRLRSYSAQHPPGGGSEGPINADGTFRFQGALPGEFELNVVDIPASRNFLMFDSMGILDITGIEVKVPIAARGRVVVLGEPRAQVPLLNVRNVYDPGQTGGARGSTTLQRITTVRPDGSFTLDVVFGDQNISVLNLPPSFSVKSITYGPMDLLKGPLQVTGPLTSEILVTLEAVAAPR